MRHCKNCTFYVGNGGNCQTGDFQHLKYVRPVKKYCKDRRAKYKPAKASRTKALDKVKAHCN